MFTELHNGVSLRWFNTAGFEMILSGGAHLLVDPWLDSATIYPFPLEKVERADYVLLSHVHFDHAQDIGAVLGKFPRAKLFVGDLSVDALCAEQHISLTNIYRVRSGEEYAFDDVKINVFAGRHTENAKGEYRPKEFDTAQGSLKSATGWYGSMELQNYLITAADGTRVLIWAGQTTPDQKYRLTGLKPNIAIMHLSPKQDPNAFAELVEAIGAQVVIPHHYDMTEPLFAARPELLDHMLTPEAKAAYVVDGKFNGAAFVERFNAAVRERVPYADMLRIEHHKWYRFGFGYSCE